MTSLSAEQLQQLLQSFQTLAQQLGNSSSNSATNAALASSLEMRIGKFFYEPESGHTFQNWLKRYGNFIEVDGKDLDISAKVRLLVGKLGDAEYARFADSILPKLPDQLDYNDAVTKLKEIFGETRSLFVRRFECLKMRQQQGQDIGSFISTINAACENADLALSKETLKCLIMVVGLRDEFHDIRQRCLQLLEEARKKGEDLTLEKLGEECRAFQLIRESAQSLVSSNSPSANALQLKPQIWKEKHQQKSKSKNNRNSISNSGKQENSHFKKENRNKGTFEPCFSCGSKEHWRRQCPNRWAVCTKCGKKGHLANVCHASNSARSKQNPSIQNISIGSFCMATETHNSDWWHVNVEINGLPCEMKLDTASQIAVFTTKTWEKLHKPQLENSGLEARNCNGAAFQLKGSFKCTVSYDSCPPVQLTGYVSDHVVHDLLGLPWIRALHIIPSDFFNSNVSALSKIPNSEFNAIKDAASLGNALKEKFKKVFSPGLGLCTKMKAHLHLKADAKPIFCKARPVPYGAEEAVNTELDRLLSIGSLKQVDFSHWAAPILAVKKKNGKTRVCIDFSTGLNNAIELNRHPLPRPEDIYASLHGAKFFSQIDLRDAYLQIELDEASKKLCGVNTHRGLMQCQRLPFGVKSAPAIFQQLMDQMLSGLPGVFAYLDDIIIATATLDEHISILFQLFSRIQKFGLKIQMDKCSFLQTEIKFLGHIITPDGIRPNPSRSDAIRKMPEPTDASSLRSFLGALNYYGRFIKPMREIRGPLDELLCKDKKWEWTEKQQNAFDKAKQILLSDLALTHYDPKLPIVVAADASKDGIGAVISHIFPDKSEKVVEHASLSFTPAQRNYSQIEKEALALIFAVQKFHRMLFGRHFILQTDHKPLLAIFGSKTGIPIYAASRLQRWALILLNYDFELKYIHTDSFGKADVLSRLIADYPRPEEDILIANIGTETELYVNSIYGDTANQLPITTKEIAKASSDDPILQKLSNFTRNGWPQKCRDPDLLAFFPKRQEISIVADCLVFGTRTIIPQILQKQVLKALHLAHPGIVRMKALAREHVYWPRINSEIETLVRQCEKCQQAAKIPPKVPLCPWPAPKEVFERVHIDFAGPCPDGFTYLLVVDAYSKWPEVFKMTNTTAFATIKTLQALVNRLGIPKKIVSDNGTQFQSSEFAQFCKSNGIKHTFSPPYHPQSNGQVERFVDTFKRAMEKCREEGSEWAEKALLAYRTTPHSALNGYSPDQLFLGRHLRTKLSLLHPPGKEPVSNVKPQEASRQRYNQKMRLQFDAKHGTKLVEYTPGESVFILNYRYGKTHWLPGTIFERVKNSPSYRVSVPSLGRDVHRHANQLRRRLPVDLGNSASNQPSPAAVTPRVASPRVEQRSERPHRTRRPTRFLEVDPSRKTYQYRENSS